MACDGYCGNQNIERGAHYQIPGSGFGFQIEAVLSFTLGDLMAAHSGNEASAVVSEGGARCFGILDRNHFKVIKVMNTDDRLFAVIFIGGSYRRFGMIF